jgi:hypothetical protein
MPCRPQAEAGSQEEEVQSAAAARRLARGEISGTPSAVAASDMVMPTK